MRNSIRLALCCLLLAFAAVAIASGEATAAEKPEMKQRLDALAEKYPEFAGVEKAYAEKKEAFLNMFTGPQKTWAENLLAREEREDKYTLGRMSDDPRYAEKNMPDFLRTRRESIRYMELVTGTPFTDPAFLTLLRPVCLNASYNSDKNLIRSALAEFDAYAANPQKDRENYLIRRVNGQYWAAILFPATRISTSGGADVNMAFVMRVKEGAFTLNPIIAPTRQDYYIGEKSPLRPEKSEPGPNGLSAGECVMNNALTVTNTEGPFAFRADAQQLFSDKGLSYICEPKCTGFTYTWSEASQTYLMRDGFCREDSGWKPRSPFDGTILLPVADFFRHTAAKNEALVKHEREVKTAVEDYLALFEGQALELAKERIENWRFDRQFPLYSLVGKEKEFAAARLANDAPVLAYLRKVTELAKTPDARLALLLNDYSALMDDVERVRREKSQRAQSARNVLYNAKRPVWFVEYARQQLALLAPPDQKATRIMYAPRGLEGGNEIAFTYERRSYRSQKAPQNTYVMRKGSDGAFWGYASLEVDKARGSDYERILNAPQQHILRVVNGKVTFVALPLPTETEFFTKPQTDADGRVLWPLAEENRTGRFCEMAPAFTVDTTKAPFAVKAVNTQRPGAYISCVPECVIPYVWNGATYVKGAPECLPEGKWGAFKIKRDRR